MTDQFPPPPPPAYLPYRPVSTGPPGVVWAAAIITYVVAGLSILLTFVMLAFAALVGSVMGDAFSYEDQVGLGVLVLGVAAVSFLISIAACYFAWQTTKRKQWARIALAGWSGIVGLLGFLSVSPPGILWGAGAIAVIVLLFVPESNAWFDGADR